MDYKKAINFIVSRRRDDLAEADAFFKRLLSRSPEFKEAELALRAAELDFADALGVEKLDEDIKNVIAVRTEDEDGLGQVLKDIVESEAFHDAIMADDSIFRDFDKPQWWVDKYGEDA